MDIFLKAFIVGCMLVFIERVTGKKLSKFNEFILFVLLTTLLSLV